MLVPSNSDVDRFRDDLSHLPALPAGTRLGLAVSGGPDSSALLWLVRQALPRVHLCVAIVDHGLRAESASEAQSVMQTIASTGLQVDILRWEPPKKVTSGKMEQARLARYWLLQKWAAENGILRIWLGHHADDQTETVVMRQRQGSAQDGLRGMERVRSDAEVLFERPLLSWRKTELLRICREQKLNPVDDPTNRDVRTERGRLRQSETVTSPLNHPAIASSRPCSLGMVTHPLGHLWVQRSTLSAADLQAGTAWVRGGHYAPSSEQAQRALSGLKRSGRASLFGCVVEDRSEGWVLVTRETRTQNPLKPKLMENGQWRVDDRWIVDRPDGEWGFLRAATLADAADLVTRATASCLTWNNEVPEFEDSALMWPGNRATFSPRRPLIFGSKVDAK